MEEVNLPEGWLKTTLEKLSSDISYGYTASSTLRPVGPKLLRITDIQDNKVNWSQVPYCQIDAEKYKNYELKKNDLVFARTGATVGKSYLIKDDVPEAVYASYLIRVRCISHSVIRFLTHFFRSQDYWNQITNFSAGIGQPNVNGTKLKQLQVPIASLAEQKVIADKLDTLLAQVESTKARLERIPQILKRFRQSVLAAAVSGKLTEEWREEKLLINSSDQVEYIVSQKSGKLKVRENKGWDEKIELYELPSSWSWTTNHKLAEDRSSAICAGPFGTIFKAKDFRNTGIPIIFLRHVKESGFNQDKPTYMDMDVWSQFHQDYSVYGGELLVTKLGDPPGDSCIYPSDLGTAMVTPDVLKMNVDARIADTKYLMYFFNSPIAKKMVSDLAFGATRLRIDIAMFKNFPIPLPSTEEQTEIVRRVEQQFAYADTIEQQVQNALARVNNLTQSILAKAFRGELTEQWRKDNPDLISGDNSAEALLEKIKAEREATRKHRMR
jgi:type I restriction enzyme S subunit